MKHTLKLGEWNHPKHGKAIAEAVLDDAKIHYLIKKAMESKSGSSKAAYGALVVRATKIP